MGGNQGMTNNTNSKHKFYTQSLTYYLKKIGKQDEILGGPGSVGPVAKHWSWQEATEAECWQGQSKKVGRSV